LCEGFSSPLFFNKWSVSIEPTANYRANMTNTQNIDWEFIRLRWESGESSYAIAKALGRPTKQGIDARIKREQWKRHDNAITVARKLPIVQQARSLGPGHKRTPERVGLLLHLIERGSTEKLAAQACGLSQDSLTKWKREDSQLAEQIRQARSGKVAEWIGHIDRAAVTDWRAADKLLQSAPEAEDWSSTHGPGGITVVLNIDRDGLLPADNKVVSEQ
jgi:hypothetical protein